MEKKLPMALVHESCGRVVFSNSKNVPKGSRVVMIPNTPFEKDEFIGENYLRSSMFRASGSDGFMQDLIALDEDRVVVAPEDIDLDVLAFTEFVSISYHTIQRFERFSHGRRNALGIWGDGNLAYCTALLLRYMCRALMKAIFQGLALLMRLTKFATFLKHLSLTTPLSASVEKTLEML